MRRSSTSQLPLQWSVSFKIWLLWSLLNHGFFLLVLLFPFCVQLPCSALAKFADFTGDGINDLVCGNFDSVTLSPGTGGGHFGTVKVQFPLTPPAIKLGLDPPPAALVFDVDCWKCGCPGGSLVE